MSAFLSPSVPFLECCPLETSLLATPAVHLPSARLLFGGMSAFPLSFSRILRVVDAFSTLTVPVNHSYSVSPTVYFGKELGSFRLVALLAGFTLLLPFHRSE